MVNIENDIAAIGRINVVPAILEMICKTTGMGFAAIARVTTEHWVACSVNDEIQFGLIPGGELTLDTTICHEIRQSGQPVVIDHVKEDEVYYNHHTPAMYGFQSYISMPIFRKNSEFFGTLCAIDPRPSMLNTPEIIGMFKAYANLIAFYLDEADRLPATEFRLLESCVNGELKKHLDMVLSTDTPHAMLQSSGKRDTKFTELIKHSANRINALVADLRDVM